MLQQTCTPVCDFFFRDTMCCLWLWVKRRRAEGACYYVTSGNSGYFFEFNLISLCWAQCDAHFIYTIWTKVSVQPVLGHIYVSGCLFSPLRSLEPVKMKTLIPHKQINKQFAAADPVDCRVKTSHIKNWQVYVAYVVRLFLVILFDAFPILHVYVPMNPHGV